MASKKENQNQNAQSKVRIFGIAFYWGRECSRGMQHCWVLYFVFATSVSLRHGWNSSRELYSFVMVFKFPSPILPGYVVCWFYYVVVIVISISHNSRKNAKDRQRKHRCVSVLLRLLSVFQCYLVFDRFIECFSISVID